MSEQIARQLPAWMIVCVLLLASGCSHQPRRVDCDGRLEPINPATPVAKADKSNGTGREP